MKNELMAATALTASAFAVSSVGIAHAQSAPFNWSGIYLAVGGGAATPSDTVTTDLYGNARFKTPLTIGVIGAGVNFDLGGALLFGFEADVNFIDSHNEGFTDGLPSGASVETSLDRLLTLRGRLGVKANRAMFFATGGLAAANASLSTSHSDLGKTSASGQGSRTLVGWSAGGGVEIAATRSLAISLSALYYKLEPLTVNATGSGTPYTAIYTPQGWLLKAGVVVKLY
jgi:outer membrane immunogenic protein